VTFKEVKNKKMKLFLVLMVLHLAAACNPAPPPPTSDDDYPDGDESAPISSGLIPNEQNPCRPDCDYRYFPRKKEFKCIKTECKHKSQPYAWNHSKCHC